MPPKVGSEICTKTGSQKMQKVGQQGAQDDPKMAPGGQMTPCWPPGGPLGSTLAASKTGAENDAKT